MKKFASYFLALDQKFKITQNDIIKIFIKCRNPSVLFWQLIKSFNNVILSYFKLLINWKDQVKFNQLIKKKKFRSNAKFNRNFWSTEKIKWNLIKWSFPIIMQYKWFLVQTSSFKPIFHAPFIWIKAWQMKIWKVPINCNSKNGRVCFQDNWLFKSGL